jgi:hypothetical protein
MEGTLLLGEPALPRVSQEVHPDHLHQHGEHLLSSHCLPDCFKFAVPSADSILALSLSWRRWWCLTKGAPVWAGPGSCSAAYCNDDKRINTDPLILIPCLFALSLRALRPSVVCDRSTSLFRSATLYRRAVQLCSSQQAWTAHSWVQRCSHIHVSKYV